MDRDNFAPNNQGASKLDESKIVMLICGIDIGKNGTIEAKKMIVAQFINQVRVGRDYHMEIDLNANYDIIHKSYLKKRTRLLTSGKIKF